MACNSAAASLSSLPFPPHPPSLPPTPSHPLTLLVQATPSADTAMFFYQTNKLGFTPEFLGRVSAWNRGRVSSFGGRGSELSCLSSPLRSPRPLCADPALPLSHQIRLAGAIASLAGVALYNTWLKKVPLKKMLMWVHRPWIGWPWIKAHPPSCVITLPTPDRQHSTAATAPCPPPPSSSGGRCSWALRWAAPHSSWCRGSTRSWALVITPSCSVTV